MKSFFVACPKNVENLVLEELEALGIGETKIALAGVEMLASVEQAYRVCLWSRLANRVYLLLDETESGAQVDSREDLYQAARQVVWSQHFTPDNTFAVDFHGTNEAIKNSQFGAMCVKDAIVDHFQDLHQRRPTVDKSRPDIRVAARLANNRVSFSLDLSGESLHRRGYRTEAGEAPLKENLAAALLLRSGWPDSFSETRRLLDPMCGSGTLLIEAVWMAADVAPGILRERFGFCAWRQHQPEVWDQLKNEAKQRRTQGVAALDCHILGRDRSVLAIEQARRNVVAAGLDGVVHLACGPVQQLTSEDIGSGARGLVITNPPYGERLGEIETLRQDYRELGEAVKASLPGWRFALFTAHRELAQEMRLRADKTYKLWNGAIASQLFIYELLSAQEATLRRDPLTEEGLSSGAKMVLNRLRKNQKKLRAWRRREAIECYRLYDADMPEYSAAIDIYGAQVHIQEYAAPATVEPTRAQKRWRELLQAASIALEVVPEQIAVKVRRQNKGASQYQRLAGKPGAEPFIVNEGRARLWVDLHQYLDTGLFLDHRPLRLRIASQCYGKRFLNLFCYTASATVHAALGGASGSVSVDMSNTYLEWAEKNLRLNRIHSERHQLVRSDCRQWLEQCREGFDLILLDPPSFSNSKRMSGVLDIQKDHAWFIRRCVELLNPNGLLYFSTNLRSFKMDPDLKQQYRIEDITRSTIDPDFERNPRIHQCFTIQQ